MGMAWSKQRTCKLPIVTSDNESQKQTSEVAEYRTISVDVLDLGDEPRFIAGKNAPSKWNLVFFK